MASSPASRLQRGGPIWENALLRASGPRVEEGGLTLIPAYPYSAPYEDLRLKR